MSDFHTDTKLLISLIETRSVLWDKASDIYEDRVCNTNQLLPFLNLLDEPNVSDLFCVFGNVCTKAT
jgi:hypothetical protein